MPDTHAASAKYERISAAHAALTRVVGAGLRTSFPIRETWVEMRLDLLSVGRTLQDAGGQIVLDGSFGELAIADGIRLVRALTGIDIGMAADAKQRSWLFAAALGLLAETSFRCVSGMTVRSPDGMGDPVVLRMTAHTDSHAIPVDAIANASAWLAFLGCGRWESVASSSTYEDVPVTIPIRIAAHDINAASLGTVNEGDIFLPAVTAFACSGQGCIDVAGMRLRVRHGPGQGLEIIAVEASIGQ